MFAFAIQRALFVFIIQALFFLFFSFRSLLLFSPCLFLFPLLLFFRYYKTLSPHKVAQKIDIEYQLEDTIASCYYLISQQKESSEKVQPNPFHSLLILQAFEKMRMIMRERKLEKIMPYEGSVQYMNIIGIIFLLVLSLKGEDQFSSFRKSTTQKMIMMNIKYNAEKLRKAGLKKLSKEINALLTNQETNLNTILKKIAIIRQKIKKEQHLYKKQIPYKKESVSDKISQTETHNGGGKKEEMEIQLLTLKIQGTLLMRRKKQL